MSPIDAARDITTVKLPERMDSTTAAGTEAALRREMQPGAKVIIDGSAVVYMSAAGVRTLASVLHAAEAVNARVVFCSFAGPAVDCLEVSGFSQLLDIAESLEAAADRLKSTGTDGSKRLHPRRTAG